jgi:hypothetical protein
VEKTFNRSQAVRPSHGRGLDTTAVTISRSLRGVQTGNAHFSSLTREFLD